MSIVVADAGPLIALSSSRQLLILSKLFRTVFLPSVVLKELRLNESRAGVAPLAEAVQAATWLRIADPENRGAITGLDAGETAAIHLAREKQCPLLIDERRGRIQARRAGVSVVGTGRILIAAKKHGLISLVGPELNSLQKIGYRLSPQLVGRLLELAGEG